MSGISSLYVGVLDRSVNSGRILKADKCAKGFFKLAQERFLDGFGFAWLQGKKNHFWPLCTHARYHLLNHLLFVRVLMLIFYVYFPKCSVLKAFKERSGPEIWLRNLPWLLLQPRQHQGEKYRGHTLREVHNKSRRDFLKWGQNQSWLFSYIRDGSWIIGPRLFTILWVCHLIIHY